MNYDCDDTLFTVLLDAAVQRRGILPPRAGCTLRDAARDMAGLPLEEQRRMKRKFRKAWRTAARRELAKVARAGPASQLSTQKHVHQQIGLGVLEPTRANKRARKSAVVHLLRAEAAAAREALDPS